MSADGSPQLVLKNVTVNFSGFVAVSGFDFSVDKGELRCLIGPNGAGKTTALDLICGKVKPSAGDIQFKGRSIRRMKEYEIARDGIGRKFQVPSVFGELSVRDNLYIAHSRNSGILHNLKSFGRRGDAQDLERLSEMVGLEDHLDRPATQLSHGQTQWLEIALLVAQDPELILMDEPTAGMTAHETQKTARLFHRLRGRHTLIVVEHDMGFVRDIAEEISVMHLGKLLAEGSIADIEQNEAVREAYLGSGGIDRA